MERFSPLSSGRFFLLALAVILSGCQNSDEAAEKNNNARIEFDLDKSDERRLLSFYMGGMLSEGGLDPFDAGIILEAGGEFVLDMERLGAFSQRLTRDMQGLIADGTIEWDEFEQFMNDRYYAYRGVPPNLIQLMGFVGDWTGNPGWFSFEVEGVMSPHRRRIHISMENLRSAIAGYRQNEDQLIYDTGTTFVSEHIDRGRRVEVSVMQKRSDGYWDFYAYGEDGRLVGEVRRSPTNLTVPSKCIGCHFGSRLFEPERSFPADAAPGPDGPRRIYVGTDLMDADVVRLLDEHRRRSDTVLGLYGTLFLSRLRDQRNEGSILEEDRRLLEAIGL